jgi:hypothetical protein
METQLQQTQDNTLAGGPLWGDAIQLDYFAVSSSSVLRQIDAELHRMLETFSRGPLWNDIHAAYVAVSSALRQINAILQRMPGTVSRRQLWYDIHAAYVAVSSALRQIEADIKAREDNIIEADIKTRE